MNKKYKKIVIGIDQSYARTGISISADGELKKVTSLKFKSKTNTEKRAELATEILKVAGAMVKQADEVMCILERIRLRSKGFLNLKYISSMGALNAVIIDSMHAYGIKTYSVDTRCWKSQVVGSCKQQENEYGVPPEKWLTVLYVIRKGFEDDIKEKITGRKEVGTFKDSQGVKWMYDNDACDSACISLFGFVGQKDKLQLEE